MSEQRRPTIGTLRAAAEWLAAHQREDMAQHVTDAANELATLRAQGKENP